jgi:hypothetical protein
LYIDVEGDPDRDFYYLVGLRIGSGGSAVHYSFWANDLADERSVWEGCLRILRTFDNPRLIPLRKLRDAILEADENQIPRH